MVFNLDILDAVRGISLVNVSLVAVRVILAIVLVVVGLFLGKLIKFLLRKTSEKMKLDSVINYNFINLALVIIKWSIYLIFLNLALIQLPFLNEIVPIISQILIVVPAITGAIILLSVGLAIAVYLKEAIEDSEVKKGKFISQALFFFVVFVVSVYSIKVALVSIDSTIVNYILIIFAFIFGLAIAYKSLVK